MVVSFGRLERRTGKRTAEENPAGFPLLLAASHDIRWFRMRTRRLGKYRFDGAECQRAKRFSGRVPVSANAIGLSPRIALKRSAPGSAA
jgi:hypothetical protein